MTVTEYNPVQRIKEIVGQNGGNPNQIDDWLRKITIEGLIPIHVEFSPDGNPIIDPLSSGLNYDQLTKLNQEIRTQLGLDPNIANVFIIAVKPVGENFEGVALGIVIPLKGSEEPEDHWSF